MNTGGLQFDQTEISTGSRLPDEYLNEDEIIGYVEPWVVSPDEDIAVKVHMYDAHNALTGNNPR
jgi:hypothetical protein